MARDDEASAAPGEEAVMRSVMLSALCLGLLLAQAAPAQPADMKATAPEKMTPPGDAKAIQLKIPMEQKADFVKKCMAEMK
jgi:hypothetical protein